MPARLNVIGFAVMRSEVLKITGAGAIEAPGVLAPGDGEARSAALLK
jgi:hypothetical protein